VNQKEFKQFLLDNVGYQKWGVKALADRYKLPISDIIQIKKEISKSSPEVNNLKVKQIWKGPKGETVHYGLSDKEDTLFSKLLDSLNRINPLKDKTSNLDGDNALVVSLPDVHYGRQGTSMEKQEEEFISSIRELANKADAFGVSEIVFPVGSDFFNTDNSKYQTTAGTQHRDNTVWQETFIKGTELIIKAIHFFTKYKKVKVLVIPGNHDREKSFYLGVVLQTYFKNSKKVVVDNTKDPRKYTIFGKNMFGFSHGKYEKKENLPLLMAQEATIEWGKTKFRDIFIGHLHHHSKLELTGVNIHTLPSLANHEEWEKLMGFHSKRQAQAYLFHKENGPVGYFIINK
jgi:hypothetical protein